MRRSPGFASKDDRITRWRLRPSRNSFQWPKAMSSLTVARQRGIHTRFPVFAERQRRAFRRIWKRSEKPAREIYRPQPVEVKWPVAAVARLEENSCGDSRPRLSSRAKLDSF